VLCPSCKTTLSITERSGIEIDWCPTCRGVWLDRGELDKIIERAGAPAATPPPQPNFLPPPPAGQQYGSHADRGEYRHGGYKQHKKKSFLSDIFDFD
jgi:Zn-finger nucleic acid-binding protein